jgi:phosphonoacetaldehyde hydrolase
VIDHGSLAPVGAFRALFEEIGLDLTNEEIREPMGMEKRQHIRRLLRMPRIQAKWLKQSGKAPDEELVDSLYERFVDVQVAQINRHSVLIPGACEVAAFLKQQGIQVGTTTGYSRAMIGTMLESAREQGFDPACVVAGDEVSPRPSAAGVFRNLLALDVPAVSRAVKVDDTEPGIREGLNAGCWTVGVLVSGNTVGLSWDEWQKLSPDQRENQRQDARDLASCWGAHYLIDSVACLPEVIIDIHLRIEAGELP